MTHVQALAARIEALPPTRRAEVERYVAFVAESEREAEWTRAATAASAPTFATVWDNDEDAAYDEL